MFDMLMHALAQRPSPYASTGVPFWDDPYISGQMLAAHLNPSLDAATRSLDFVRRSADWIATLAGGKLLDLGCGPGIYAELFAERGFAVTGVDISARSIEYAKQAAAEKGLKIDYRRESYLDLDSAAVYDIAVLIYCDYGVLSPEDRARVLRNARRALQPGGVFIVDGWTPAFYRNFGEEAHITAQPQGGFWSEKPYIEIKATQCHPQNVFLERYIIVEKDAVQQYNLWNTAFDMQALEAELRAAGFGAVTFFGDVAGGLVTDQGETLCAVARA